MRTGIRTTCVLAMWLVGLGCASREAIYSDIQRNRAASFQRWKALLEGEKEEGELLKGKLGLSAAVQIALGNNKKLMVVLEEKEKAKGQIVEAMSYALPTATLSGTYLQTDSVPTIDVGPEGPITLGRKDSYVYGVNLKQPIFTGGAASAAIRGARVFQYLTDETIRTAVQEVTFQTRKAYYDVLLQEVLLEVAETSLRVAEEHLAEVKTRRKNGVASDFDVLRAQVEVSNFQALAIEQKNKHHISKTILFKILGVSQESEVEFSDSLEYQPVKAELVGVVEKALSERPDLFRAELEVKLQKEAIKVAQSGWLPKIFLFADWERFKPSKVSMTNLGWDEEVSGGVTTEIPLFDGLKTLGRVMQEKASLRQKEADLKDAEERALLEARQAYLSLRDAAEFVESQKANLERAQEGFRLADVGYRNGVNTQVEVLDAQEALTRTRGNYYRAVYDHMMAKLMMEKATGALAPKGADPLKKTEAVQKNPESQPKNEWKAK